MAVNVLVRGDSIPGYWYDDLDTLLSGSYTVQLRSNPAQTLAQWGTEASTIAGFWDAGASQNIVVFHACTNDFFYNLTVTDTCRRLRDWCETRKLEGWKVIVCTMTPRDDFIDGAGSFGGTSTLPGNAAAKSAEHEVRRLAFNTFIRDHYLEFADGYVDLAGNSNIGDKGDELNATYYSDEVHPAAGGQAIMASLVEPVIYAAEAAGGNGWLAYRRSYSAIVADTLVYYTGDENADGTGDAGDSGPLNADGTWTGTPGYATGPFAFGKAFDLAAGANRITTPAWTGASGEFCVEFRIKIDTTSGGRRIIDNRTTGTNGFTIETGSATTMLLGGYNGSVGVGNVTVPDLTAQWRHVVVRCVGLEGMIYVDGLYRGNTHGPIGGMSAQIADSTNTMYIGQWRNGGGLGMDGQLYGLRCITEPLGPADIKTLYDHNPDTPGAPTNTTPPSIAGTPTEGQTLTFTPGDWSNADSVATQWFENSSDSTSGGTPISSFSVYRLRHVGKYYYVREIGTNVNGETEVFSDVVGPVAALATQVRYPCQAETSGTQLNDTSGNARHCTLTGTAGIAAMREQTGPPNFPQMIRVNASGLDDVLGFSYTLGGTTPYTIGMWVRLSLAITGATINRYFVTSPDTIGMTHDHTGGAYQDAIYRGSAGFPVAGLPGRPLALGSLVHVASVFDGTQMIPYVNGVAGTPTATAVSITNATTWSILFENRAAFCDFRIYNQALNANQMADWVASGGGGRRQRRMGFGFGIGF